MTTYSQEISLMNKIFLWDDIVALVDIVNQNEIARHSFCITIGCEGGLTINYNDVEEFKKDEKLSRYRILSVTSDFRSKETDILLHIDTNYPFRAYIKLSCSDKEKFYSIEKTFEDEIKLIKNQKYLFFTKNNGQYASLCFLLLATLAMVVFCIRVNCMSCMFFTVAFIYPSFWCADNMQKTYPAVEFEFIPDWKNTIKKRRSQIKWWIGAVLLPLILSAAWDWIKLLWQRWGM